MRGAGGWGWACIRSGSLANIMLVLHHSQFAHCCSVPLPASRPSLPPSHASSCTGSLDYRPTRWGRGCYSGVPAARSFPGRNRSFHRYICPVPHRRPTALNVLLVYPMVISALAKETSFCSSMMTFPPPPPWNCRRRQPYPPHGKWHFHARPPILLVSLARRDEVCGEAGDLIVWTIGFVLFGVVCDSSIGCVG
ncbi:hypothetical protein FB45DRAFT_947026 [Roridomyces roridus]|uniref:Uncharacterized protein n=1 Tax=Roridomyces roridus TaxID=1738132 RepID=A0AAD7FAG7_9AGAR|nr:hypothetical protein FB45DRAFT_947026 [Roridomyces roridus]